MFQDDFLDAHQGILQSIEMSVVAYYRNHQNLVDYNVEKIYNGIQRTFDKEIQGKNPPRLKFSPLEQELFDNIERFCRIFVGDAELSELYEEVEEEGDAAQEINEEDIPKIIVEVDEGREEDEDLDSLIDPVSKEVVVQAMKRLRKSIKTWTGNTYGKQGYLNYISNFM